MNSEASSEDSGCGCLSDDPETAAAKSATASGFAGSVFGAVGGPVGAEHRPGESARGRALCGGRFGVVGETATAAILAAGLAVHART